MLAEGFVRLYRTILEHPIYQLAPDCVLRVWIACLARANWRPTRWYDGHQQVEIPAGAFIFSQEKFAKTCCVSRDKLRTALRHLQNLECITIRATSRYSLLVVEKWSTYQPHEHALPPSGPQHIPNGSPAHPQHIPIEEEVKKERREEKTSAVAISWEWEPAFNEWWEVWSRVRGTQRWLKASEAYALTVTPATQQNALECASSYVQSLDRPNQGFYPDTFLRQQAEDGFRARFPRRKAQDLSEKAMNTFASNIRRYGRLT